MQRRDLLLGGLAVTAAATSEQILGDLERDIPSQMAEFHVPGLSLALIRGARIVSLRSFGVKDVASRVPVTEDTMFEAASMSKPVFAYAVMKAAERGVLNLDKPLVEYTADRPLQNDARLERITARQVLSHTAGFQNWRSPTEPLKIHFDPGTQYLYSGEGYAFLQSVLTKLDGKMDTQSCTEYEKGLQVCATDFDPYMKAHLLRPFGMTSSGYIWNKAIASKMARPHDESGKPVDNKKSSARDVARYGSAGALLTSARDYARFLIQVISPRPQDRYRLSEASVREMIRPHVKVQDGDGYSIHWALGWRVAKTKYGELIAHGGDNAGFHCTSEICISRQSGFVAMTNGELGYKFIEKFAPILSRRVHQLPS